MPLHFFVQKPVFSVSPSSFSLSPIYSQNILQRGIEQTLAQIEESSQDSSQESTQEVAVDAVEAVLERRQGSFSVAKSTSSGGTSATVTKCICLSRSGNE
jgi:hypothetical protein